MDTPLPRKQQKIFSATSDANGVFGSAVAGTFIKSNDLDEIQSLPAWQAGWQAGAISAYRLPTIEEMNGLFLTVTQQLAYLFQRGVPEYLATDTYPKNAIVAAVNPDGNVSLYASLQDNNVGHPVTDDEWWGASVGGSGSYTIPDEPAGSGKPYQTGRGYVVFPSGYMTQFGFVNNGGQSGLWPITFPVAFRHRVNVQTTFYFRGDYRAVDYRTVASVSLSGCSIILDNYGSNIIGTAWLANGF